MDLISDGRARRIASEWHNGQTSALYSFVSTGGVTQETVREVTGEIDALRDKFMNRGPSDDMEKASFWELIDLRIYLSHQSWKGLPVEGWSNVWENQG